MNARYPIYELADLTVLSRDVRKELMAEEVLKAVIDARTESAA
jgi:shikimate kinase